MTAAPVLPSQPEGAPPMNQRTIWYAVADLTKPSAEPFAVLKVDTSVKRDGGVEGMVESLHWSCAEAEHIVDGLNHCGETDCTFQDGWCKCGMEG